MFKCFINLQVIVLKTPGKGKRESKIDKGKQRQTKTTERGANCDCVGKRNKAGKVGKRKKKMMTKPHNEIQREKRQRGQFSVNALRHGGKEEEGKKRIKELAIR